MGRLFQVNDQVLLDVTRRTGRGLPPVVIPSICVNSEPHNVVLRPKRDDVQVDIGSGGVTNLFEYYQGLRPPPPPPGTVDLTGRPSETTFDNLQKFASDQDSFKGRIAEALKNIATERCPDRADTLSFTIDGDHEGTISVHRLYCIVLIDLYVAVNLRGLMESADDYDDFIESVTEELRQTGKTYVSQEASILRGGQFRRDFPIVRRTGLTRLIAYIKVGIGTFVFQSGWDVEDNRQPCGRKEGKKTFFDDPFKLKYQTVPRREGDEDECARPEFEEPEDNREREDC